MALEVADATCPDAAETAEVEDVAVATVALVGAPVGSPRRFPMLKLVSPERRPTTTTRIDNCFDIL